MKKKFIIVKGDHRSSQVHTLMHTFRHYITTETIHTLNSKRLKYYVKINRDNVKFVDGS